MLPTCRHILTSGRKCNFIALRGKKFCYHHDKLHIERRSSGLRSRTKTQTYDHGTILVADRPEPDPPYPVSLEFPEEPAAILTNIYRVTSMLIRGEIDRPTANSVTYGMQVCLSALNGKSLVEPAAAASQSGSRSNGPDSDSGSETTYTDPSTPATSLSRPVHRVILTPEGDEIAPPAEILEDNEAEPVHHRGCPCLRCAERYRNQPAEEHHPDCTCGLCEEQEPESSTTPRAPSLAQPKAGNETVNLKDCHPEGAASIASGESRDLQFAEPGTNQGAPFLAQPKAESENSMDCHPERSEPGSPTRPGLARWSGEAQSRHLLLAETGTARRPRIARASSLLSGSTNRDHLNRPWSVAEYTFGDAIRRHEAQFAARAAACLAVGIEPPPYEPFTTGLIPPGHPDYEEEQQMQQHSSEYWATHFRRLIAERPNIQQYLEEEKVAESARTGDCDLATEN